MALGVEQERQLLQVLVNNSSPVNAYLADKFDDVDGGPKYYGFLARGGKWYIMREVITGSVSEFTYFTDTKDKQTIPDYETAWTGRASLNYNYSALTKFY